MSITILQDQTHRQRVYPLCSSTNAVSFSSVRTMKRFPQPCASTIQIVRPSTSRADLLRERPKFYRQVVRLLGEGCSANKICKWCHVTRETVRAVESREGAEISARKKSIVGILSNVAELGAARMGGNDRNWGGCGQGARVDESNAEHQHRKHPDAHR